MTATDQRPRRVVIILNPVSGPGNALKEYRQTVQPALDAAGVQHTLHVTEQAQHASAITAGLDLSEVDAMLFMGGDGTVHESLQGLLGRPDWQKVACVPMAQLPAGSGNALAANSGMWNLATALHAVVKGRTAPIDIISVLQPPHARRYAFLSITFGMIANLDIGTEHLRWMGGARFTVGALQQILGLKSHQMRLAYLPATARTVTAAETAQQREQPGVSPGGASGPATPLLDDLFSESTAWSEGRLPQGWRQHPNTTVQLFAACNLPFLDMSYNLAPRAGLSSGCIDIVSTCEATRMQGLQFMLKSETGQHLDLPVVDYQQAAALAMEPISNETWMVVDGETVPFTRLYAQVHPGLCTVLVA